MSQRPAAARPKTARPKIHPCASLPSQPLRLILPGAGHRRAPCARRTVPRSAAVSQRPAAARPKTARPKIFPCASLPSQPLRLIPPGAGHSRAPCARRTAPPPRRYSTRASRHRFRPTQFRVGPPPATLCVSSHLCGVLLRPCPSAAGRLPGSPLRTPQRWEETQRSRELLWTLAVSERDGPFACWHRG